MNYYQDYQAYLKGRDLPYSYDDMDDLFHQMFMDATSNVYFLKTYELINSQIKRMRIMSGECSEKRREETIQEHLKITKCALKQDWDGAADAMKEHLHYSKNAIFDLLFKGNDWSL